MALNQKDPLADQIEIENQFSNKKSNKKIIKIINL